MSTTCLLASPAAFEFDEGPGRTFQIAFTPAQDDAGVLDQRYDWLTIMNPYWRMRLDDVLAWLNPVLGLVAGILALLTIAAAAERFPRNAATRAVPNAGAVGVLTSAECA